MAPVGILEYLNAATGAGYTLQELMQAGERIITAGALLRLAGGSAGCHATQKNDYQITVMKGHSVSEVILADTEIEYTWMEDPSVDIALAPEGVNRRKKMLADLSPETVVIKATGVELAPSEAVVIDVDFKDRKIKSQDWAMAALAVMARQNKALTMDMLTTALKLRFKQTVFEAAMVAAGKIAA